MLQEQFKYYLDNQENLVKKYNGKFLVIKDLSIKGNFDSFEDALTWAAKEFEIGTFLIQECTQGDKSYKQTFHSRVIFA